MFLQQGAYLGTLEIVYFDIHATANLLSGADSPSVAESF
jgi:hypothetical protein